MPLNASLEAILARVVHVANHRALAGARESRARVEPVGEIESRVRPENQVVDASHATPFDAGFDQRTPGAASALVRVEIESMKLGAALVELLDTDRSYDRARGPNHEEAAARRRVVSLEVEEIGHFDPRLVDEPVLRVDPTDERDDPRDIVRGGREDQGSPASAHDLIAAA